jgi:hypothetical protein
MISPAAVMTIGYEAVTELKGNMEKMQGADIMRIVYGSRNTEDIVFPGKKID